MSRITNKEVRDEAARLKELGFVHSGGNRSGHPSFEHPEYGRIVLPATPSDHRWKQNHRTLVARRMGISTIELERRLGNEHYGRKSEREKGPGRKADTKVVLEHAAALSMALSLEGAEHLIRRFSGVRGANAALDKLAAGQSPIETEVSPAKRLKIVEKKIHRLSEERKEAQERAKPKRRIHRPDPAAVQEVKDLTVRLDDLYDERRELIAKVQAQAA